MAKSYLTANALVFVAQAAVVIAAAAISEEASASKPCNPDPAVPCNAPPKKTPVAPRYLKQPPQGKLDVVGRDLAVNEKIKFTGVGEIGHVGVWIGSDSEMVPSCAATAENLRAVFYNCTKEQRIRDMVTPNSVIEVLNNDVVVNQNTYNGFSTTATYWGASYFNAWGSQPNRNFCHAFYGPDINRNLNQHVLCDAYSNNTVYAYEQGWQTDRGWGSVRPDWVGVARAVHVRQVGALEYTLFRTVAPTIKEFRITINQNGNEWTQSNVRGIYRCDTFVEDVLKSAGLTDGIHFRSVFPYTLFTSLPRERGQAFR
jgi:hypothetical protein